MSKVRIEVHQIGNQFVAYDEQGNQVKDRYVLEQISFDQMPGFKTSYYVYVDASIPEEPTQLEIYTNITTQKR